MHVCRIETTVSSDGTIVVKDASFVPGEHVEVVVRGRDLQHGGDYPLRGTPLQYVDPFESVAETDWEALQ
jgi:hypothetical protein